MALSIDTFGRYDYHAETQGLKAKVRRLEGGLLLAIAGIILLATKTLFTPSSISARVQEIENAFQFFSSSQQKFDEKIVLLSTEEKTFLQELKQQQNHLAKQFAIFENCDETSNTKSNFHKNDKYFSEKKDKKLREKNNDPNEQSHYKSLVEKEEAKERRLKFRVVDWLAESYNHCASKPILNPINYTNDITYNERVSKLLEVFVSLSSFDAIHNDETPQYKAACYILYDDVNEMGVENELTKERYILYLFLISTEVLRWGGKLPPNSCDVDGILCNPDGYIIELRYGGRNLVGTIPIELGNLRCLQVLDFDNNKLNGTLPTQLGRLTELKELWLFNNRISGTLPSEIGKMKKLKRLDLYDNKLLSGSIPSELFDATELIILHLNGNSLTGTIPTSVGKLHKLKGLYLHLNQLTGTLPTQIGMLSLVTDVLLYNNKLEGQVPTEIMNWRDIWHFSIFSNQLAGTLPDVFDNFEKLELMFVNDNLFTGKIPSSIWRVGSLRELRLHKNDLSGSVPDGFCNQTKVLELDDSSWFDDSIKVDCSCCNKSCILWDVVTSNKGCHDNGYVWSLYFESGISFADIKDVHTNDTLNNIDFPNICRSQTGCYEVEGIDIKKGILNKWYFGYSNIYQSIIESDPKNPICDAVDICGKLIDSNHPRRRIIDYITQIGLVTHENLYDTTSYQHKALCWMMGSEEDLDPVDHLDACDGTLLQFCIMGLFFYSTNYFNSSNLFSSTDRLCDFTGIYCDANDKIIEEIQFPNKNLTGSLISEIGLLRSLRIINVSENEMRGTIDESIFEKQLPNLEIFDVSNNAFGGEVPHSLFSHPNLKELKISSNQFAGTLPSSLLYSFNLESFDVSDNLFQGPIPESLLKCFQLHTIAISQNNFDGTISSSLGELSKLRYIRYNENQLTGSIPNAVFNLKQMKEFMIQSNKITGSIPTSVGNLNELNKLVLNHNKLKGNIPSEIENLSEIQILHTHQNQLTGIAPTINKVENLSYITDCGFPNYALPGLLECESCTKCCNSEDACQEVKPNMMISLYIILGIAGIIYPIIFYYKQKLDFRRIDLSEIYTNSSVHSFIFTNDRSARIIYILSICVQFALFIVYQLATQLNKEDTDWQFTYQCPDNSIECINLKKVNKFGWVMFSIVILCFIGPDVVMSLKQLEQGIILKKTFIDNKWLSIIEFDDHGN